MTTPPNPQFPTNYNDPAPLSSSVETTPNFRRVIASSIDLVRSYGRSQSFIGENLPASLSQGSYSTAYRRRYPLPDHLEDGTGDEYEEESSFSGFSEDEDEEDNENENENEGASGCRLSASDQTAQLERLPPNSTSPQKHNLTERPSTSQNNLPFWTHRLSVNSRSSARTGSAVERPNSFHSSSSRVRGHRKKRSNDESSQLLRSPYGVHHYGSLARPLSEARTASEPRHSHYLKSASSLSAFSDFVGCSPPPFGTSTFGQTLFNAFNVLCGVGLLSEPLAFASVGWIGAICLFVFCGLSTNYTAKVLARLMAEDRTLLTYNDICYKAFGRSMQYPVALLFCLELFALSVALMVIFGDSFATIFPTVSSNSFKLLAFVLVLPTVFMPFQILSYTSLIGLASSLTLLSVVIIDGLVKKQAPGSLFDPAPTSLSPSSRWGLSAGLMMSSFSGHSVMPSLARDMKNPQEFNRMVDYAYLLAGAIYFIIGVVGYLMFGQSVSQEISQDILKTEGFPRAINQLAIWMIGINPIAKFALSTRPLNLTIEHLLHLSPNDVACDPHAPMAASSANAPPPGDDLHKINDSTPVPAQPICSTENLEQISSKAQMIQTTRAMGRLASRTLVTALVVIVAIIMPDFERVMSFLGSFSAFVICTILPVSANLILSRPQDRTKYGVLMDVALLIAAVIMAAIGTTFSMI